MPNEAQEVTIVDGSLDWSGGVNSYLVPTVASEQNPNGLKRSQISWGDNLTFRGGGITQRPAWQNLGKLPAAATGLYQGSFMYEPDSEAPYIMACIGGHIWKIDPDNPDQAVDESVLFQIAGGNATITGQVTVTLRQNGGPAAGGTATFGTAPLIGNYNSFYLPGPAGLVNVSLDHVYNGILQPDPLAVTVIGVVNFDIIATNGWVGTSTLVPAALPSTILKAYLAQAENFLVIQAGDLVTLPLIWDGTILRQSLGLSGAGSVPNMTGFGKLVLITSANFTIPALNTPITIPTTTTYTGALGDYLSTVNGAQTSAPFGVGSTLLNYSNTTTVFVVTAIGANSITGKFIYYGAGVIPGNFFFAGFPFYLIYFLSGTPNLGGGSAVGTPEIPSATAMDYYMGRLWYAQGRQYGAGDIVGDQSSGTLSYNFRDSVLKITENPMAVGGDGFTVPTNAGNIRAIKHSANINTALGEGQLYIFTRRAIYSLRVPVTRTDWIGADTNNQPLQTVVQITNGSVNDRTVTEQNGDLFYQSFEPAIRSLVLAIRYYDQWGNTPISINEDRILRFNDRGLMQFASGVSFDNRMLQLVLPEQTPVGVAFRAVIPLNFDVISTLETKLPPVWEGMYEGQPMLELLTGDFGGRQRCFAPTFSDLDGGIHLWEISTADKFENGDNRVLWYMEFPSFTWGDEFMLKKLVSAELWFDRIFGEVMFSMDYRPDGYSCWLKWHEWKLCTARTSCEDVHNPQCVYPKDYCESFRETITLPNPPSYCVKPSGRPSVYGYQFQCRLTIKGFCRVRGVLLKAQRVMTQLFGNDMVC